MRCDLAFFPSLPPTWRLLPLKAVCGYRVSNVDKVPADDELPVRLCNYTDVYNNDFITLDMGLMRTTATAAEIDRFGLAVGDVAITKDSETWEDIGVPAYVVESAPDFVCGYHLAILRSQIASLDGRFLFRCLQARPVQFQFERAATGVTRFGLPIDAIGRLYIPVPPLESQRFIAAYLDRETAKIDAMIAAKRRLVELLEEQRKAVITHAVTRGLNRSVPLRDSGVEWIGKIPEHWVVERAKYLIREVRLPVRDSDEMVTCFRDGQVTLRSNRREDGFTNAVKALGYQGVRRGHLVVHSMDAFAGAIGVSDSDGKCTPEYIICEPARQDVCLPYYGRLLRVMALAGFVNAVCAAVRERAPRIHFSDLGELRLAVPPAEEQAAVCEHVDQSSAPVVQLRNQAIRSIGLLQERRRALISEAVTGKLGIGGRSEDEDQSSDHMIGRMEIPKQGGMRKASKSVSWV